MNTVEGIRTDDLAMAAYLNYKGFKHSSLEMKDRRSGQWVFDHVDGIAEEAECYQRADALVEPLKFNYTLREVRQELYNFLKGQDNLNRGLGASQKRQD